MTDGWYEAVKLFIVRFRVLLKWTSEMYINMETFDVLESWCPDDSRKQSLFGLWLTDACLLTVQSYIIQAHPSHSVFTGLCLLHLCLTPLCVNHLISSLERHWETHLNSSFKCIIKTSKMHLKIFDYKGKNSKLNNFCPKNMI